MSTLQGVSKKISIKNFNSIHYIILIHIFNNFFAFSRSVSFVFISHLSDWTHVGKLTIV